jgi:sugar phosphate isomerase/epimerase
MAKVMSVVQWATLFYIPIFQIFYLRHSMRYSLCSYSLHRTVAAGQMDLFGYFRFCQEAGYTQLDPWNEHIKQAYDDNGFLAEIKAAATETGLPMGCIAVDGAHIYEPTTEGRELNRTRRYRWLEIAHELGAEQLRIDAGGRDQTLDEIFDVVVEGYKDIISRAQAQGIEIIIENHWGPTNHPAAIHRLLAATPGLGLLFDSYNWPAGTHEQAWRECVPYARLTHFKTFSFDAQGNEPEWDLPRLIGMLQAAGYQGAWGVESSPYDNDEIGAARKSIALLKRVLGDQ